MADEDELVGEGNAEAAPSAAEGADVAGGSDADGNDELLNEEAPEYESEEVVDDEPKPPTEEEIRQMEEEAVKAELRALGIPSDEEHLEN
ncbi:hypothetical protein DIPPA_17176 [Diplonema papillatum]|nr:hypothetical protein DIPPA_17176 [Diplonema papillatum]